MLEVPEVSMVDVVFGADALKIMPKYEDIPAEFKDMNNKTKWNKVTREWFFRGLKGAKWTPKRGVDTHKALAAIQSVLGSFSPKHEHKEAAVAYMLSEWFEDVTYEPAK